MRNRLLVSLALLQLVTLSGVSAGQGKGGPPKWPPARHDTTPGFIIKNSTVLAVCGDCHVPDTSGRMERLSYMRKSPEGWEMSIRRMATVVGARFEPNDARVIAK